MIRNSSNMWINQLGEMYSISAEVFLFFYFAFAFQSTLATSVRHVASVHWLGTAAPTLFISPGEMHRYAGTFFVILL